MKIVVSIAVVVAGFAAACSSSSGGTAADAQGFAQQYCALLEPCCAGAGLSTSGSQCELLVSSASANGSYDASAGQACLDATKTASQQAGFCASGGGNPPACQQVFSSASGGTKQPGEACSSDSDCAVAAGGGATCWLQASFGDGGVTASTSTCIQTSPGSSGSAPCIGTVNDGVTLEQWGGSGSPPDHAFTCDLASGVSCDTTTQACKTLSTAGQDCVTDSDCVAADFCSYSSAGASTCTARAADGSACSTEIECSTTSYCGQDSQLCAPLLASGAACTTAQMCQSASCSNGTCTSAATNIALSLLCGM